MPRALVDVMCGGSLAVIVIALCWKLRFHKSDFFPASEQVQIEWDEETNCFVYVISAQLFAQVVGARFDEEHPTTGRMIANAAWLEAHSIPIPQLPKGFTFPDGFAFKQASEVLAAYQGVDIRKERGEA